jgi:hypothetical protein
MNLCHYFKHSHIIYSINSDLIEVDGVDYIIISPEETENFHSGKWAMNEYRVVLDNPYTHIGRLVNLANDLEIYSKKENRIYQIPIGSGCADLTIRQNNKTCTAILSPLAKQYWQGNLDYIVLAACVNNDPEWPAWVWNLSMIELIKNDVIIEYQGNANFTFFTKKILNSYLHEHY